MTSLLLLTSSVPGVEVVCGPVPRGGAHSPLLALVLAALCFKPLSRLTMGLLGFVLEEAVPGWSVFPLGSSGRC